MLISRNRILQDAVYRVGHAVCDERFLAEAWFAVERAQGANRSDALFSDCL